MPFDAEIAPPRKRVTNLYQEVLSAARRTLIEELAKQGVDLAQPTIVAQAVARATLKAQRERSYDKGAYRIGDQARRLAAMKVGDSITVPPVARQTCRGWMDTASGLMNNPDARWRLAVTASAATVTRVPDGADIHRGSPLSAITQLLIGLQVGECVTYPDRRKRGVELHQRHSARRALGEPSAEWKSERTTKGLRITRTA